MKRGLSIIISIIALAVISCDSQNFKADGSWKEMGDDCYLYDDKDSSYYFIVSTGEIENEKLYTANVSFSNKNIQYDLTNCKLVFISKKQQLKNYDMPFAWSNVGSSLVGGCLRPNDAKTIFEELSAGSNLVLTIPFENDERVLNISGF